jgi:hypothetical protein
VGKRRSCCVPEPMINTGRRAPFAVPPAIASSIGTMIQDFTSLQSIDALLTLYEARSPVNVFLARFDGRCSAESW